MVRIPFLSGPKDVFHYAGARKQPVRTAAQGQIAYAIVVGKLDAPAAKKFDALPLPVRNEIMARLMDEGHFVPFVLARVDLNYALNHPCAKAADRLAVIDAAIARNFPLTHIPTSAGYTLVKDLASGPSFVHAIVRARAIRLSTEQLVEGLLERIEPLRKFSETLTLVNLVITELSHRRSRVPVELRAYELVDRFIKCAADCLEAHIRTKQTHIKFEGPKREYAGLAQEIMGLGEQAFPALAKAHWCPLEIPPIHQMNVSLLLSSFRQEQPLPKFF